jgi:hypothetical protein
MDRKDINEEVITPPPIRMKILMILSGQSKRLENLVKMDN